jgi:uncharacterized protein DUF397
MRDTPPDFAPAEFRKSSFSGENGNNCIEIAERDHWTAIRDSKTGPRGPRLVFKAERLAGLILNAKLDEADS